MKTFARKLLLFFVLSCLTLFTFIFGEGVPFSLKTPSNASPDSANAEALNKTNSIIPTTDFATNFCNFPQVWRVSRGKNVSIGIVFDSTLEKQPNWVDLTSQLAPESEIKGVSPEDFLSMSPSLNRYQVILFQFAVEKKDYERALASIRYYTLRGSAVIVPAYFGPMLDTVNYDDWVKFIKDASAADAIIVGAHGREYQVGSVLYWARVPVDIYAISSGIDGMPSFQYNSKIKRNLETTAFRVAAAAALLKSYNPLLLPASMKQFFQERGRKVFHVYFTNKTTRKPTSEWVGSFMSKEKADKAIKEIQAQIPKDKKEFKDVFKVNCLDAGLLLGLKPMDSGEWSCLASNIPQAQKAATGKGVVVAILDHMFDQAAPCLKDRMVAPGSVLPGEPVFSVQGHGTWMAEDLIRVAPDVKIMPVRICGEGRFGDADLYIKGIEYAVKNGASIISLSHQAIPEARQKDFDAAIEKASKKGVTFVFINYLGNRQDVVTPGMIEFAPFDTVQGYTYVIGTNFITDNSFPFTWGMSPTSPIVSGVIAMMKELNPKLKPMEIKNILLNSTNPISGKYPLLDAEKAVLAVKNGK